MGTNKEIRKENKVNQYCKNDNKNCYWELYDYSGKISFNPKNNGVKYVNEVIKK